MNKKINLISISLTDAVVNESESLSTISNNDNTRGKVIKPDTSNAIPIISECLTFLKPKVNKFFDDLCVANLAKVSLFNMN
ncbi:hypothetical protein A9Q87_02625 [Flavobacteriales bacterium 34_180_T64]|nr:hypothetical protein A9Q87_02625 [Flavobacteriales bacterium 34_180_T64]